MYIRGMVVEIFSFLFTFDNMEPTSTFKSDYKLLEEAQAYKKLAIFSVFVCTLTCFTSALVVPSLYGYMQSVQSTLQVETDYCKTSTGSMWAQFAETQMARGIKPNAAVFQKMVGGIMREKRQSGYESPSAPVTGQEFSADVSKPCSCKMGLSGEAGAPGTDGLPGAHGLAGRNGKNGADAKPDDEPKESDFCFVCEEAQAGAAGPAGPKGPNGQDGAPGAAGSNGQDGQAGAPGAPGQDGKPGSNGQPGAAGKDGVQTTVEGPAGPAGPAGNPGAAGQDGAPGANGNPGPAGSDGKPGAPGAPGAAGQDGANGDVGIAGEQGSSDGCSHCPTPRSAPGY